MLRERLVAEVGCVVRRCRQLRWWRVATLFWLIATLIAVAAWWLAGTTGRSVSLLTLAEFGLGGSFVTLFVGLRSRGVRASDVVRRIESQFPELNSCLLAAIEQQPTSPDGRLGYLQESVVRQALAHAETHDWRQIVPGGRIANAVALQFVTLAAFVVTVLGLSRSTMSQAEVAKLPEKSDVTAQSGKSFTVEVEPGDTEIERGTSLLVLARVTGELPAEAALILQPEAGDETKLPMSRALEDPVFGGRVPNVTQPMQYRIELGGETTATFRVSVFEYPKLERADARLVYPSYTGLDERLVQDVRTVTIVEGTQATIICRLNKHVRSARFVESVRGKSKSAEATPAEQPNDANSLVLKEQSGQDGKSAEAIYEVTLTADRSRRLKLELVDESGRRNVEQFEFTLNVTPNKPPTLKLVQPARDLEVSPLEELDVKATAWDDFGLKRVGLTFAIAGHEPTDVVLASDAKAREKHDVANAIKFEELQAEPDQLLSYHFWAEDFGPDGQVRRTESDMFFAEVRHFEEIFRQGQQPPGGQQQQQQGQNAQQAQELANSQKDIINATWKLIRRETGPQLSAPFATDVDHIAQAQKALLEKSQGLAEKLKDAQSLDHLEAVLAAMRQAVERLTAAHDGPAAEPLKPALAAEQAAYQALLKLRAREHEIVRQQQQSSSSSSQSARSQQQRQQMDQLEMKKDENRYETERLAQQKQESEQDRETRQVLNRLRELAQRQHDLNERLKDLQSALQEAATPERRDEIKQQLKRLQDEQRQVLRDTDELQSRMESATNQEQMSEQRQQVEQTREDVRRAAEALEQEQVSQATAAGRRAEQQFDELRDEFRRRASNRFNEEMREMRQEARDLDMKQKELSQQLAEVTQPDETKPSSAKPNGAKPESAKSDNAKSDRAKSDSTKSDSDKTETAKSERPKPAKPKSLREDDRPEQISQGLANQKEKLNNLTERMKQTVAEAEETEPLLAERLHDAARNVQSQNVDKALDATTRSLQRGLNEDARQVEQIANQGISQLREGVEKAAEAVLGDEAEALRRAREALRQLSEDLNREIAANSPNDTPRQSARPDGDRAAADRPGTQPDPNQPGNEPREQPPADRQNPDGNNSPNQQSGDRPQSTARQQSTSRQSATQRSRDQQQPSNQPGQPSGQQSADRDGQQPDQQSGQQPGQQPNQQQRPGRQPGRGNNQSERPGQQSGQQPAQQPGGQQPGQQPGQKPGQQQSGQQSEQQSGQQQSGQPGGQPSDQQSGQRTAQRGNQRGSRQAAEADEALNGGQFDQQGTSINSPITGEEFVKWSDRLRDVEEMVDDPELRAEAARIREQARAARAEFKRHSKEPNWSLIRVNVAEPLTELQNRIAEELLRRNSHKAIVPLDRDPVPPKFSEKTRRYYEQLGRGQ